MTIGRAAYASGEGSYSINDVECRALDVAELLSDTGLGREHHTIVSQGRLDDVLAARPEERRLFIEEAAGILKHRRRKERALRKLAQVGEHLERLDDLLAELARQRGPLARQAKAADRHAALAADLTAVRLRMAVRELDRLERAAADDDERARQAAAALEAVESRAAATRAEEAAAEAGVRDLAPSVRDAADVHVRLTGLAERLRGLTDRIQERRAGLVEAAEEPVAGRDPALLRTRAADERAEVDRLEAERAAALEALEQASGEARHTERRRRAHEQAAAAEARRRAEARERHLRWEGQVAGLRSTLARAAGEQGRLAAQLTALEQRTGGLAEEAEAVDDELCGTSTPVGRSWSTAGRRPARRSRSGRPRARAATRQERELERRRASLEARVDALRAASTEPGSGVERLRRAVAEGALQGVVGPLAAHLDVDEPHSDGGRGPCSVPLPTPSSWRAPTPHATAWSWPAAGDGRVHLVVADDGAATGRDRPSMPATSIPGARRLLDVVGPFPALRRGLEGLLGDVHLVPDLATAARLAAEHPEASFVTREGEVAGARGWAGGTSGARSAVETVAAVTAAESALDEVTGALRRAGEELRTADAELARGQGGSSTRPRRSSGSWTADGRAPGRGSGGSGRSCAPPRRSTPRVEVRPRTSTRRCVNAPRRSPSSRRAAPSRWGTRGRGQTSRPSASTRR